MDSKVEPSQLRLVSPSRITNFQRCAKRYHYEYVEELKSKEPPKGYFNKGNYFHELAHAYYQLIKAGMVPGSDTAVAIIKDRIRNDFQRIHEEKPGDRSLIPMFGLITKTMLRYIKEQSPRIDVHIRVKGVEMELIYPFADNLALLGYADLVYHDGSGNLRVRDHKSGEKAKSKNDAASSTQLMTYACILWKLYGEVPIGEISYINTKDYVKQAPPTEKAFGLFPVTYSEKELAIFFDEICRVIDMMLNSDPLPTYGEHCAWCPFETICTQSRKGIDPTPFINAKFRRVPRESQRKPHGSFTDEHSNRGLENLVFGSEV